MVVNMNGKWFMGLNAQEDIDCEALENLAQEKMSNLIIAGASAFALCIDLERIARIAKFIRCLFHGGHDTLCRADRYGRPPESGITCRFRDHHPQKPVRLARWRDHDEDRA